MSFPEEEREDPLLFALGYPPPDNAQGALVALHRGAAYHRLALLCDVSAMYAREMCSADEPAYAALLRESSQGADPRTTARRLYRTALRINGNLAEAWFNLGRLLQDLGDLSGALLSFDRAASLPSHERAQPHAHLQANAHWHAATILEDLRRDKEALARYREAIARCDNFGVHQTRYAHFLRRLGFVGEAVQQYEKAMVYSHRYFSEFVLPPLTQAAATPAPSSLALDVIYETSRGDVVVFLGGEYYQLPKSAAPIVADRLVRLAAQQDERAKPKNALQALAALLSRLGFGPKAIPVKRAASISEFEA